jgi:hypothetical protein
MMPRSVRFTGADFKNLSWQKSESSNINGQCVEIAPIDDKVAIRDSKDPDGPMLICASVEFSAFLEGARNGEFDHLAR